MSEEPTLLTAEHYRYIAEHTRDDDDFLRDLKARAVEEGIPEIWINPAQGSLMQILLRLSGAREVVEVGTLAGYSAIVMARALGPEGRVRTIEVEPRHAAFAERMVAASDVSGRVQVILAPAQEVLPTIPDASVDALFLDAEKSAYGDYLVEGLRLLRRGGLLMVDNALAFGQLLDEHPSDPEVGAIRDFNDLLHEQAGFHGVIVPLGDGFWAGIKD